jgi:hypothetical protein
VRRSKEGELSARGCEGPPAVAFVRVPMSRRQAWTDAVNRPQPVLHLATSSRPFARFMREERGLSPVTILTRCQRVAHFLTTAHVPSLQDVSVSQVDSCLVHQGRHGWSRLSMAALDSRWETPRVSARPTHRPGVKSHCGRSRRRGGLLATATGSVITCVTSRSKGTMPVVCSHRPKIFAR